MAYRDKAVGAAKRKEWREQNADKIAAAYQRTKAKRASDPEYRRAQRRQEAKRIALLAGREYIPRTYKGLQGAADHDRHCALVRRRIKQVRRAAAALHRPKPKTPMDLYRVKMQDPGYRLHQRMKVAIRKAMKGAKDGRRWESLVGYTRAQLVEHLQRTLPKGYTMTDIEGGKLHIDHIVPKSLFDAADPNELRAAWALPNLRLLPAAENLSKGAKRVVLL